MTWTAQEKLDAELLDTIQTERQSNGLPMNVRTAETKREYPTVSSREVPSLRCPYCGRRRCREHSDLPSLDPFYEGE